MLSSQRLMQVFRHPGEIPSIVEWRKRQLTTRVWKVVGPAYWASYCLLYGLPSIDLDSVAAPLDGPLDPILDRACLPPHAGSTGHNDMIPLLRIVRAVDPATVLEFGTAHGNTVANVCKFSRAHVYTVNAPPEEMTGRLVTFALSRDQIGCVYRDQGFADRVTQIYANTLDFDHARYGLGPTVDLAIIDACHDTPYVLNDFQKVLPCLSERATVLFHDTHPSMRGHLAGSYTACMKLRRWGYDIKHVQGTWWGIWQKRPQGPPRADR